MASNGVPLPHRTPNGAQPPLHRAEEAQDLLSAVQTLVIDFISAADQDATTKASSHGLQQPGHGPRTTLLEHHPPQKLTHLLDLPAFFPAHGRGKAGLLAAARQVLHYSVNTWDQGFLDKLYAATTPPGLAADLLLSACNTNLHVYQVAPALTAIEKRTARALAEKFGLRGPFAGGVSQPGGSAANQTSIVVARNCLFPETKSAGYGGKKFVLFTSAHGHYSVEKAAQMFGFGSEAVRSVGVDGEGRMMAAALEAAVVKARDEGETPFYVNATAGTTVLGSFDPFDAIADVCAEHGLWLHVDGSWGGPVVFSAAQRGKLAGSERADSIALCPHKMMGVPLTCSFLLGKDLRQFHKGMTLPAGYLFHGAEEEGNPNGPDESAVDTGASSAHPNLETEAEAKEVWDLADLTPQCGRRGDSLKLALSWTYYGSEGLGAYIDQGFEAAAYLASLVSANAKFSLLSTNPPPCLQVCFYFRKKEGDAEANSRTTEAVTKALIPRGFMVDFAPGEEGRFFRVVVNGQTRRETCEGLVRAVEEVGENVKV